MSLFTYPEIHFRHDLAFVSIPNDIAAFVIAWERMHQYGSISGRESPHLIHPHQPAQLGGLTFSTPVTSDKETSTARHNMYGVLRTNDLPSLPEWRAGDTDSMKCSRKLALFDWVYDPHVFI